MFGYRNRERVQKLLKEGRAGKRPRGVGRGGAEQPGCRGARPPSTPAEGAGRARNYTVKIGSVICYLALSHWRAAS